MNRIRTLRRQSNLTQAELAERAEIDQAYLSRIESGRRPGSIEVLRRIAAALNVGLTDLFERDGRDQIMVALLEGLTPEQQEQALAMLEVFVKALRPPNK